MPADYWPDDGDTRPTHNFAPGYYGLVYREELPDSRFGGTQHQQETEGQAIEGSGSASTTTEADDRTEETRASQHEKTALAGREKPEYRLQSMKWGLIPFWTKRNPDYGSMMKTINCRDDSLLTNSGMWTSMKQKKRCIVICQGFFEWLKKNDGRDKLPHFVKRKDAQLMCFAGLWDCVKYEDSTEKLFTYTIITTDSNKQLGFLHDRMPVILDNGSDDMFKWLDSSQTEWTKELQSLLKPYQGQLECYPVVKDVGKVGNDSATFIVPLDSPENKQNIANFFGNQKKPSPSKTGKSAASKEQSVLTSAKVEIMSGETRATSQADTNAETHAPVPVTDLKRSVADAQDTADDDSAEPPSKSQKTRNDSDGPPDPAIKAPADPAPLAARSKPSDSPPQKRRSATSNSPSKKTTPVKGGAAEGTRKITSFFTNK